MSFSSISTHEYSYFHFYTEKEVVKNCQSHFLTNTGNNFNSGKEIEKIFPDSESSYLN